MIEFRLSLKDDVLYLEGSDSLSEWVHHFLPFAGWRERAAGKVIVKAFQGRKLRAVVGHSLGAAVGSYVAKHLNVPLYVYGGKAAPWGGYVEPHAAYRHKGDIVPWLTPWRRGWRATVIGDRLPPWRAHGPATYYEQMANDDVR